VERSTEPTEERAKGIICLLVKQAFRGMALLAVARNIRASRASNRLNCAHWFFGMAFESALDSSILSLYKLLIANQDSITIPYLVEFSAQNAEAFPGGTKEGLKRMAAKYRKEIDDMTVLRANLTEKRDKTIAHLDKKHLRPTSLYEHPNLSVPDIERAYQASLRIIDAYAGLLSPSEDNSNTLDQASQNVDADFAYILGLVEKANAGGRHP
jgi:hypothetical protein